MKLGLGLKGADERFDRERATGGGTCDGNDSPFWLGGAANMSDHDGVVLDAEGE